MGPLPWFSGCFIVFRAIVVRLPNAFCGFFHECAKREPLHCDTRVSVFPDFTLAFHRGDDDDFVDLELNHLSLVILISAKGFSLTSIKSSPTLRWHNDRPEKFTGVVVAVALVRVIHRA